MTPFLRFLTAPALLLLATVACGSQPRPVPVEEAAGTLNAALCEVVTERCPSPELMASVPPGLDCEAMLGLEHFNGYVPLEEMVESGRVSYDAEAMARVVEDFRTLPCWDVLQLANSGSWWDDVFRGTVEAGGTCYDRFDCVAGTRCGGGQCPGTCEPLAAAGEACQYDGDCLDGRCGSAGTCEARPALGEPCSRMGQCAEGAACGGEGTCLEAGAVGAWCYTAHECRSGYCALEDGGWSGECAAAPGAGIPCRSRSGCPVEAPICVWEGDTGLCRTVAERRTAGEGEACDVEGRTAPLCREGLGCARTGSQALPFACRRNAASGEACASAVPSLCPAGEYCDVPGGEVEGSCRPLPVAGEACAAYATPLIADALITYCAEGFRCERSTCGTSCSALTCVEVRDRGEACEADVACETFQCGGDGLCTFDFCD